MSAARSAATSGSKTRSQPGPAPIDQDAFTTWGASSVPGSPSGSSSHWNAWWTAVTEEPPESSNTRAAIQEAPGALPIVAPLSSPPTITPVTPVPCPERSVGVVGCWP